MVNKLNYLNISKGMSIAAIEALKSNPFPNPKVGAALFDKNMNLKTIFKRLILLDLLLFILIVVAAFYPSAEVEDFNKYFESEFSNSFLIIIGVFRFLNVLFTKSLSGKLDKIILSASGIWKILNQ